MGCRQLCSTVEKTTNWGGRVGCGLSVHLDGLGLYRILPFSIFLPLLLHGSFLRVWGAQEDSDGSGSTLIIIVTVWLGPWIYKFVGGSVDEQNLLTHQFVWLSHPAWKCMTYSGLPLPQLACWWVLPISWISAKCTGEPCSKLGAVHSDRRGW